jgi:hypothetical protein
MKFCCPICFCAELQEPPLSSFEICPCCGVEFGYEDSVPERGYGKAWQDRCIELRNEWLFNRYKK